MLGNRSPEEVLLALEPALTRYARDACNYNQLQLNTRTRTTLKQLKIGCYLRNSAF